MRRSVYLCECLFLFCFCFLSGCPQFLSVAVPSVDVRYTCIYVARQSYKGFDQGEEILLMTIRDIYM